MNLIDVELIRAQDDFAIQASALLLELDKKDLNALPVSIQMLIANAQAAMERRDNARRAAIAHAQAGRRAA